MALWSEVRLRSKGATMNNEDAPGKFVETNGIRLHYLEFGSGSRHLVICHGITGAAETWAPKAREFAERYHVIVPDMRGHGYSDKPEWGYSLVDYGRDIAGLIEALGLGRPAVLGHSMGGRIAFQLAANHPEAVGPVMSVDPPVSGPGRRRYPTTLESMLSLRSRVEAGDAGAMKERMPYHTPEELAAREKHVLRYSLNAVTESWYGFHLEDIYPLVPRATMPTAFMYADQGVILEEEARELARLNPGMRTIRIERSGHGVPWENWPDFSHAVNQFLDETEP
jgi:N-formylmaleamate deformylase